MIAAIARSRLTLPVLLAVFGGMGEAIWCALRGNPDLLVWLYASIGPICVSCAGAVWAMRAKAESILLDEPMTASDYRKAQLAEQKVARRSTGLAALTIVASGVVAGPVLSQALSKVVWEWMVVAATASAGFCMYAYLLAGEWERQLKAHRQRRALDRLRQLDQAHLSSLLEKDPAASPAPGWIEGPELEVPARDH